MAWANQPVSKAQESATSVRCLAQLRQIANFTFMYVSDNKGVMPIDNGAVVASGDYWFAQFNSPGSTIHIWAAYSYLYMHGGGKDIFWCPAVPRSVYPSTWVDPDIINDSTRTTYGVTGYTCGGSASTRDCVWSFRKTNVSPQTYNVRKLTQTQNPAQRLMIADVGLPNPGNPNATGTRFGGIIKRGYSSQFETSPRHGPSGSLDKRFVNFVCADGHGESRPFLEVQQPAPDLSDTAQTTNGWNWLGPK